MMRPLLSPSALVTAAVAVVFTTILSLSAAGCSSSKQSTKNTAPAAEQRSRADADDVLALLGSNIKTMVVEGRLSTTGTQTMNRMPFSAMMDEKEEFQLTMGGPFGVTAAKMYARPDSFVMVNYLMQEVWDGDPRSPTLKTATHLPLPASDLMSLLRGRTPGDPSRFTRTDDRADGTILFKSTSASGVEYLLIDPSDNIIKQYQVKGADGTLQLDVAFGNVQEVSGQKLPHLIKMASQDRAETATVEVTSMTINQPITAPLTIQIPSSYERVTFR